MEFEDLIKKFEAVQAQKDGSEETTIGKVYKFKYDVYASEYPTSNCQLCFVGEFQSLLQIVDKKDMPLFCELIRKLFIKKLMLVDVRKKWCEKIDTMFEGSIVTKAPYISSNESSMCVYIINIERYIN